MNIEAKVSLKDYFQEAVGVDLSPLCAIRVEAYGGGDSGQIETIEAEFTSDYVVTQTEQDEIDDAIANFVKNYSESFIKMAGGHSFNWYDNEGGGLSIYFDLRNDTIERRAYYNTEETCALPSVLSQPIPENVRELTAFVAAPVFSVVIADENYYESDLFFCDDEAANAPVWKIGTWQGSSEIPLNKEHMEELADILDGIEPTQNGVSDRYCDESGWFKVYKFDTQAGTMDMCLNHIDRCENYEIDEVVSLSELEDMPGSNLLTNQLLSIQ